MIEELERAKKMAMNTINELYENNQDNGLDCEDIDILLDAVKVLCLVKQHS